MVCVGARHVLPALEDLVRVGVDARAVDEHAVEACLSQPALAQEARGEAVLHIFFDCRHR